MQNHMMPYALQLYLPKHQQPSGPSTRAWHVRLISCCAQADNICHDHVHQCYRNIAKKAVSAPLPNLALECFKWCSLRSFCSHVFPGASGRLAAA